MNARPEHPPHVAVIGAGFGGLALAIRLQSAGVRVTLLEKRGKPGGRAYVYEDEGFIFDAGPTVITDPSALEELFALSGRTLSDYVELLPVDPFYRLDWADGATFDYTNDDERLETQIRAFNPDDVDGYRRFLDYSEEAFQEGYVKLGHVPFLDFKSMVRAAPKLMRMQAFRSVHSMVSRFIKDEHLRQAFSFHTLLVGGNPFATSSIYALIHALERRWGVCFPRGGTGALIDGMARLFRDLGGELIVNADVRRLSVNGSGRLNRVEYARDGEQAHLVVDAVASNADVVHTYAKLLGDEPRGAKMGAKLKRRRFSNSLFVLYFGLSRTYPDLKHHTIVFGPRYRELIDEIFAGHFADDFSLYLHAPCATDPSVAPPGSSTYYALVPVPNLARERVDWETEAPRFAERIYTELERRLMPGLREHLVTQRIFTPFDFKETLNAHVGSAFSLEPILRQSAYFRVHNRDNAIPNLYFVGAGTHPGAGIPGVIGSAKATAGLIHQDLKASAPTT